MNKKKVLTVYMDPDLHNRLMNVIYWTPGASANWVINEFVRVWVEAQEKDNGAPYTQRDK